MAETSPVPAVRPAFNLVFNGGWPPDLGDLRDATGLFLRLSPDQVIRLLDALRKSDAGLVASDDIAMAYAAAGSAVYELLVRLGP